MLKTKDICDTIYRVNYVNKGDSNLEEKHELRNKLIRKGILVIIDAILVVISYALANFFVGESYLLKGPVDIYIIAIIVHISVYLFVKVYRSIAKYTGAREYAIYTFATLVAGLVSALVVKLLGIAGYTIRIVLLSSLFMAGLMISARVGFRFLNSFLHTVKLRKKQIEKVLIIGAGKTSLQAIKNMLLNINRRYKIVGVIDDSKKKQNSYINGMKVIGGRENIIPICEKEKVDIILFAITNINKVQRKELLNICSETKAKIKEIPNLTRLLLSDEPIKVESFKDVQIEDLLGRDPIELEDAQIKRYIFGKTVLVTGGGGSIGSELCRQIAACGAKQLLMVDIYENTLYEIELELRKKHSELDLTAIIASVRDSKRINEIFDKYKPEIVFHAAAHKHVPLMETSPIEAIKNNVFGTYNVAKAAHTHSVDKFILVSTDKAVNPTSIMGATKRICEMIIQMQNAKSKTNYVAVRFGNVLGSNGSVIPIFKKQIAAGGPVTVTHKDITRYFMTIPEAVGLILQAITFAEGGEIFVLDMGEPVKIYDLAYKMIKLSGYEPNVDIPIQITGLRPGEKLYEELLISEEGLSKTLHEKIMVTKIMDFEPKEVENDLDMLKKLINAKEVADKEKVKSIIKKIVPTFIETEKHTKMVENSMGKENKVEYVITVDKKTRTRNMEHKKSKKKVAK